MLVVGRGRSCVGRVGWARRRVGGLALALWLIGWLAASGSAWAQSPQLHLSGGGTLFPYLDAEVSISARPVLLPNLSGRVGAGYARAYGGEWSAVRGDVWGLYELELGIFGAQTGSWLGLITPYVGGGLDAVRVSVRNVGNFTAGTVYGVGGVRYDLGGNLWAWAELRVRLGRLGGLGLGYYEESAITPRAGVGFSL